MLQVSDGLSVRADREALSHRAEAKTGDLRKDEPQPAAGERIGAVVFASPDIDLDVFTSSVARIGPLAGKITVVTTTNDRALAVSGFLAGGITRVGAAEKAELARLGLRVIDASAQACLTRRSAR
jgi:esterase/lipase superfamily enzyme